ncbi:hypothetical protein [Marinicrinis sediminis]|uniref:Uncharacterized protein n=1 Tax=Marinicrinis sediminis TaxID=1652465 RepID=A0ABW5R8S8_9BACL
MKLKKKLVAILLGLILSFSSVIALAEETAEDPGVQEFKLEVEKQRAKMIKKIKNIKADSDFKIVEQQGPSTFSFTYSDEIKTEADKERYKQKVEGFEGLATQTDFGFDAKWPNGSSMGVLNNGFEDTVIDSNPWFSDEELWANGDGYYGHFKQSSSTTQWSSLYNIKDTFKIGGTNMTSATVQFPSLTTSVQRTSTSVDGTVEWNSRQAGSRWDRIYGEIYVESQNIKSYYHSSSANADYGSSYSVYTQANLNLDID